MVEEPRAEIVLGNVAWPCCLGKRIGAAIDFALALPVGSINIISLEDGRRGSLLCSACCCWAVGVKVVVLLKAAGVLDCRSFF